MKEMIWEKDVVVTLVDGYKVEHLVFTYGCGKIIIEKRNSNPIEGKEDMWNNTELKIHAELFFDRPLMKKEQEEIIDRYLNGNYD
mgnify:FL=1|jgi:hypothetical protein